MSWLPPYRLSRERRRPLTCRYTLQRLAPGDKVLLIRASLPVVLRRDLSLTRRLHAWLLGGSDAPQDQMEHLRKFALEPLRTALVEDMTAFEPAADATSRSPHNSESVAPRRHVTTRRQRAFKIFISLLDKWEIGAPLTEVAVMDAFAAVQAISEGPLSSSEEVRAARLLEARKDGELISRSSQTILTAQLLYDALDPMLLWRQIHRSVQSSLRETEPDATSNPSHRSDTATRDLELVRFVIKTFKIRDEEVQRLYAPVVAFSTISQIAVGFTLEQSCTLWHKLTHSSCADFSAAGRTSRSVGSRICRIARPGSARHDRFRERFQLESRGCWRRGSVFADGRRSTRRRAVRQR